MRRFWTPYLVEAYCNALSPCSQCWRRPLHIHTWSGFWLTAFAKILKLSHNLLRCRRTPANRGETSIEITVGTLIAATLRGRSGVKTEDAENDTPKSIKYFHCVTSRRR